MKAFEYTRGKYRDTVTDEIKTVVGFLDHDSDRLIWFDDENDEPRGVYVDTDTLCYSTGLVDKNGIDIFTGDTLTPVFGDTRGEGTVIWIDSEAAFFIRHPSARNVSYEVDAITVNNKNVYTRLNKETARHYSIKEETKNE